MELFTAQGCAACPPAQAVVNALADRPDVIALSFSVTYWDALGWHDRFGQPAFTERQRRYAIVGHRQLATPQVLVNGRIAITGRDPAEMARAIRNAEPADPGPSIRRSGAALVVGADRRTARPATLWLVQYDPRTVLVPIGAGENSGRILPHRNVVRGLRAIGRWSGDAVRVMLPPASRWRRVVLVQASDGGGIIAAARIS
ncbi:hypothetical protein ASG67_15080 [Sphingomonas sp. Leaf339]|nr:hypothetical protein ASG67_15080 [Sphingomonas sp. Leaf339]